MGFLRSFRRRSKQQAPATDDRPKEGVPAADIFARALSAADSATLVSPEEAAELGGQLRLTCEQNRLGGPIDWRVYPVLEALETQASKVRGKHYVEWLETLDRLRGQGADDEALPLLLECIEATKRAARVSGQEPPLSLAVRAALIYRRRNDYAKEIEVLEGWEAACPQERHGTSAAHVELTRRLVTARQLLDAKRGDRGTMGESRGR